MANRLKKRASDYMLKASREAKVRTSWTSPNEDYEQGLATFIGRVYDNAEFISALETFITPLIWPGRVNPLAQTLLKLTSPGVPDLYQGSELWNLTLVDPDNRRPVDYALRTRLLKDFARRGLRRYWRAPAKRFPVAVSCRTLTR